jgi:hypothetical protein
METTCKLFGLFGLHGSFILCLRNNKGNTMKEDVLDKASSK